VLALFYVIGEVVVGVEAMEDLCGVEKEIVERKTSGVLL
jgi:hypothetical protein